ncbi:hypothetical protein H4F98_04040 [Lysobacter spongiae]|uniref:Uncharacterized protein n=2 Tax=Marilutibacter spongiae TaxID=2025720 RepID=A0A7W3TK06_9GAMM|nr:hypothetical protein [Lysobacter spongiae]
MRRHRGIALFVAVAFGGLGFGGLLAAEPVQQGDGATTTESEDGSQQVHADGAAASPVDGERPGVAAPALVAAAGDDDVTDAHCMRDTGSRIRSRECKQARGRAHDRAARQATGRVDAVRQVQVADPSAVTINRLND